MYSDALDSGARFPYRIWNLVPKVNKRHDRRAYAIRLVVFAPGLLSLLLPVKMAEQQSNQVPSRDTDQDQAMRITITVEQVAKALVDPASVFSNPADVVHAEISAKDKIEILRRWEYDAKEMQVADEEGFLPREQSTLLDAVLAALHQLGAGPDLEHTPPTKQGGV